MCKLDTSCLLSNDGGWYASVKENSARAPGEFVRLLKVAFFIYFFSDCNVYSLFLRDWGVFYSNFIHCTCFTQHTED